MARPSALRLLAALGLWVVLSTATVWAVPRKPISPVRDYTRIDQLGSSHGLKATWLSPGRTLRLSGSGTTLEFESGSRELSWNGMRLFLGEPVVAYQRSLYLSPTDFKAIIRPILEPSAVRSPGELKLIAIDAGHGGGDPGTENRKLKLQEKTFTLDVARRLKTDLERRGYRVLMTRNADVRLASTQVADLQRRVELANRASADLFISIHFNSLPNNAAVHGVETYAFTPFGQRSTAAPRRSQSDNTFHPGNRYDHWNTVLSASIHPNLLKQLGAVDRGLKRARFAVLRAIQCPAVLIEAGFLSNRNEARKINTAAYRQTIAKAIGNGVGDYHASLRRAKTSANN